MCVCVVCVWCVLCVLCCVSCIVLRVACGVWCVVWCCVLCGVLCAVCRGFREPRSHHYHYTKGGCREAHEKLFSCALFRLSLLSYWPQLVQVELGTQPVQVELGTQPML